MTISEQLGCYRPSPSLSASEQRHPERLGVAVVTGREVTGIDEAGGIARTSVRSRIVSWAAGRSPTATLGRHRGASPKHAIDRIGSRVDHQFVFIEAMQSTTRARCVTLPQHASLNEAARLLSRAQLNLLAIVDESDRLVGVITKTDVVRQIGECTHNACTIPIASVMARQVVTCHPDEVLADVWSRMRDRGLKHMPIIDPQGHPVGVLYARDALTMLLEEVTYEELLLRDYVLGIGYQ